MSVKQKKRVLVSAALPYVNNVPHIGHIVGSHLPADIFARYSRLQGHETVFIGGSDEHGTPSELAALELKMPTEQFCAKIHKVHKEIYDWFGISYDIFSRTSKKLHHQTTQEFFNRIYKNGHISEGAMQMYFCDKDNRFLPDRYVEGKCLKCGYDKASGDQCEKCTSFLETKDLVNPKCKICGSTPHIKETKHLFINLEHFSDRLKEWIEAQKQWKVQVSSMALGWIKEGLRPRCITRDLNWGVKVPLKEYSNKVFYVWFDAPIGYVSFVKEAVPKKWKKFWQDKDTKIYHFLGKDNIIFHTIFWPAILLADATCNLPYQVAGLQYLNYEGQKISKSKKWGIFCEKFPSSGINPDIMRAYLIYLLPETSDTEFKWVDFVERINKELIGTFGNFANRSLTMIASKLNSKITCPKEQSEEDKKLLETIKQKIVLIESLIEEINLRSAFKEILALAAEGNKYFDHAQPWKTIVESPQKAQATLYYCTLLSKTLSILVAPFLPKTAESLWAQVGMKESVHSPKSWDELHKLALPKKHTIGTPSILFEKLLPEFVERFKKAVTEPTQIEEFFK